MKFFTTTVTGLLLCLVDSSEGFTSTRSSVVITTRQQQQRTTTSSKSSTNEGGEWTPDSWQTRTVSSPQTQPAKYENEIEQLEKCSPLVFAGEVRTLHEQLARACSGQGFLLLGGGRDSSSSVVQQEFNVDRVRDSFRILLQMSLVLTFGSAMPIIKIGRIMAGGNQSYDMVDAYHRSSQTLNILRAFSTGGYADISRLHAWNLDFVERTEEGSRYRTFATKVDESLRFMKAIGVDTSCPPFTKTDFFTAHECSLLPYEQALTREDSTSGKWYDCSAHMLWIGETSRQLDGPHLEFIRGVNNPLGVKISDKCTPDELLQIIDTMNPTNIPGRLTIIVRMNAEKLRRNLPGLIRAVQREGKSVLWISDPVHGNNNNSRLDFDTIRSELRAFFDVHDEMGSHPGGVHIEMTAEDVTEFVGGTVLSSSSSSSDEADDDGLDDPRLNGPQALELAFLIAERMRSRSGLPPIE